MDVAVAGRPARRMPDSVRVMLRRSTIVGHHVASMVGFVAIVSALALWFQPSWRTTLAERVMPWIASDHDAEAGAMSMLANSHTAEVEMLPVVGRAVASSAESVGAGAGLTALHGPATLAAVKTGVDNATGADGARIGLGVFGAPLDPNNLPNSVVRLVRPSVIVADARFDHAGTFGVRDQARVAGYIARRYRVAQEPIDILVRAAYQTGRDVGLDPLLLLAVMAVESGFNPYAESGVGARGLMQVMPAVHSDKFDYYGGTKAALEPVPNLRVGALILKDYIGQCGSVAGGLRRYVGSTSTGDGGYGAKVMAERDRLRDAVKSSAPNNAIVTTAATTPAVVKTSAPVAAAPSLSITPHNATAHSLDS